MLHPGSPLASPVWVGGEGCESDPWVWVLALMTWQAGSGALTWAQRGHATSFSGGAEGFELPPNVALITLQVSAGAYGTIRQVAGS